MTRIALNFMFSVILEKQINITLST